MLQSAFIRDCHLKFGGEQVREIPEVCDIAAEVITDVLVQDMRFSVLVPAREISDVGAAKEKTLGSIGIVLEVRDDAFGDDTILVP